MARQQIVYWWKSGTLYHAQVTELDGSDPSDLYTSTDLADALEQAGYRKNADIIRANEAPDLTKEVI
jgi:hypothetical protein